MEHRVVKQKYDSVYRERWQISDLPELTDEDIRRSLDHTSREWAFDFSAPANLGKYIHLEVLGMVLQNVGDYRIRCIWAMDHADSRIALAMFKKTFDSINISLEMGEHTVVVPCEYIPESEQDKQETKSETYGMEVV